MLRPGRRRGAIGVRRGRETDVDGIAHPDVHRPADLGPALRVLAAIEVEVPPDPRHREPDRRRAILEVEVAGDRVRARRGPVLGEDAGVARVEDPRVGAVGLEGGADREPALDPGVGARGVVDQRPDDPISLERLVREAEAVSPSPDVAPRSSQGRERAVGVEGGAAGDTSVPNIGSTGEDAGRRAALPGPGWLKESCMFPTWSSSRLEKRAGICAGVRDPVSSSP